MTTTRAKRKTGASGEARNDAPQLTALNDAPPPPPPFVSRRPAAPVFPGGEVRTESGVVLREVRAGWVSRVLMCVLLRINGWRPWVMPNGMVGWERVTGPAWKRTTLRGDWRYAVSRLLG